MTPHPLATKLLARVGAAGRANIVPVTHGTTVLVFRPFPERTLWLAFLIDTHAQILRDGYATWAGALNDLARASEQATRSIESLGAAWAEAIPPDDWESDDE